MCRSLKSARNNLFIVTAAFVVGLLFIELSLRIGGVSYPALSDLDPIRGTKLHPGAEGWVRDEGRAYVRINSAGQRDVEHALATIPDTVRVAILGDSFAEALQVEQKDAFWSVLATQLDACPAYTGKSIEPFNFGVSGYGTAQELITYRQVVRDYRPSIVILAFYVGNDVRNNSKALEPARYRPFFTLARGELVLDDSFHHLPNFTPDNMAWIARRNDLVNATRIGQVVRRLAVVMRSEQQTSGLPPGTEFGIDDGVFAPPKDMAWADAWEVTEALLRQLNWETRADGARLWIVTLSSGVQVHTDKSLRRAMEERLGVDTLDYPDRRIADFGLREGIPVITLLDPFRDYVNETHTLLHGFDGRGMGHWNQTGHRLAGKIIAAKLCEDARQKLLTAAEHR